MPVVHLAPMFDRLPIYFKSVYVGHVRLQADGSWLAVYAGNGDSVRRASYQEAAAWVLGRRKKAIEAPKGTKKPPAAR